MTQRTLPIVTLAAALLIVLTVHLPALGQEPDTQDGQTALSTAFTYQGRIDDSDGSVNGTCDLRFTLHDDNSADSPVGATLTKTDVPVNDGLFTVSLDFGSMFDGTALYLEVEVRCPAGSGSYETITPRQALTATPYALYSNSAPWAGITGMPAGFADGVDDDTTYSVGAGLVLSDTTLTADLAGTGSADTVARSDHNHDSDYYTESELNTSGAGGQVHWNNVTSVPAGFADDTDNDTTYSAGDGLGLQGTQFNVTTLPMMGWSDTQLDSGNVGNYSSIIIGLDGLPVISYYDATSGDLKVAHCDNMACTGATTTTLDSAGVVGKYTSITIGRTGYPLISYYDDSNGDLKLASCNNVACTSATLQTVDSGGNVGHYTSITTNENGYAFISYYDVTNGDLKAVNCTNLTCSSNTIWTVDSAGDVGQYTSVTRNSNDYGYISYYDATNGDLKVARCVSMTCGTTVINTVDGTGATGSEEDDVGHYSSITTGTDGYPLIAYAKVYQEGSPSSGSQMRVAHCTISTCSTADVDVMISANTINWQAISITLGRDGLGLISAGFDTTSRIYVFHCNDVACSEQDISDSVVTSGAVDSALTVGADGLPIVSYSTDTDDALRVVHCSDWSCQPYLRRR